MALLRSSGLYPRYIGIRILPCGDKAAETEYIFISITEGTQLSDMRFDQEERDIISITRQVAELESKTIPVAFQAGGSLYYASDLE